MQPLLGLIVTLNYIGVFQTLPEYSSSKIQEWCFSCWVEQCFHEKENRKSTLKIFVKNEKKQNVKIPKQATTQQIIAFPFKLYFQGLRVDVLHHQLLINQSSMHDSTAYFISALIFDVYFFNSCRTYSWITVVVQISVRKPSRLIFSGNLLQRSTFFRFFYPKSPFRFFCPHQLNWKPLYRSLPKYPYKYEGTYLEVQP